jgi:hypothetical protein
MPVPERRRACMATKTRKQSSSNRSGTAGKSRASRARDGASRGRDVIALIKGDHASINRLFRRFNGLSVRATKSRRNVADRLIKDLSVRAVVEEQVLYPTARAWLPEGRADTSACEAPNTPPANAIVGAVAAMIDKVRDGLRGRASGS